MLTMEAKQQQKNMKKTYNGLVSRMRKNTEERNTLFEHIKQVLYISQSRIEKRHGIGEKRI